MQRNTERTGSMDLNNQLIQAIVIITALFVLPLMAGEISYWFWQLIKLVNKDYYNKVMSN